jgi:hypothetical protein
VNPAPPLVERPGSGERAQLLIVVGTSLLVRIAYLLFKPASVVSLDVGMWKQTADFILAGNNPYRLEFTNFLPLWPATIGAMAWISRATGIPFVNLLWTLLIAAETALLGVCFRLLRRVVSARSARNILLIAIALNPAAIFQVTQHGNIDVIFMLWVMLAVAALVRSRERRDDRAWLAGCGWIGLGIFTKTAPMVLIPLLCADARRMSRARLLQGALLLLGPVVLGFALILPFAPQDVWRNVVQYRSVHGYFGLGGIMAIIDGVEFPSIGPLLRLQARLFNIGLPILILAASIRLWRRGWSDAAQIPLVAALLLLSILIFGTGFGPQHIYWLIPTLAVCYGYVADLRWRRLLALGWLVVAVTYLFEYLILPAQGGLLHALFPMSDLVYRATIGWLKPSEQTILRLPEFCVFVAILLQGLLVLRDIRAKTGAAVPAVDL